VLLMASAWCSCCADWAATAISGCPPHHGDGRASVALALAFVWHARNAESPSALPLMGGNRRAYAMPRRLRAGLILGLTVHLPLYTKWSIISAPARRAALIPLAAVSTVGAAIAGRT